MQGEYALNAIAERDTADGEGFTDVGSVLGDHDAGKHLDTLGGSFNDLGVNLDGIADLEVRYFVFQLLLFDSIDNLVHFHPPGSV